MRDLQTLCCSMRSVVMCWWAARATTTSSSSSESMAVVCLRESGGEKVQRKSRRSGSMRNNQRERRQQQYRELPLVAAFPPPRPEIAKVLASTSHGGGRRRSARVWRDEAGKREMGGSRETWQARAPRLGRRTGRVRDEVEGKNIGSRDSELTPTLNDASTVTAASAPHVVGRLYKTRDKRDRVEAHERDARRRVAAERTDGVTKEEGGKTVGVTTATTPLWTHPGSGVHWSPSVTMRGGVVGCHRRAWRAGERGVGEAARVCLGTPAPENARMRSGCM